MTKVSKDLENILRKTQSVCVLTGAGISAESGVPTFRGADGLWKKFQPEELANFDAFIRNPQLVWEWYDYRRKLIETVIPNEGHLALARMENAVSDFTLVTQNVDNLHRRAGSKNILELHGNIMQSSCVDCGTKEDHPDSSGENGVPHCKACGGLVRPDVVWFGEMLPKDIFEGAERAAQRCGLFISVGTSAIVYPAASLPMKAKQAGAYTVEVNVERTEQSGLFDETLLGKAGEVLPTIVASFQLIKGVKA
jgi:NAD-dependent deacetylase